VALALAAKHHGNGGVSTGVAGEEHAGTNHIGKHSDRLMLVCELAGG